MTNRYVILKSKINGWFCKYWPDYENTLFNGSSLQGLPMTRKAQYIMEASNEYNRPANGKKPKSF